ncbi:MAG: T9SS type A sorting domain-containing protein [Flavobacterium sp.]|uniref:T9SS type A sorting domain-containing protein n=1 Tax=Flavobacterium sp. TaxID=239 RepID=UPI0032640BDB
MKKITLLLMLFVTFTGFAQFPLPYCGPMTFTNNVEPITLVNFAGINNSSSALVGQDNGTTIIAHENYTAITGNVTAGNNYPITLKGNTDGNFTTRFRVYIDWNQNNDFTDAGESYDIGNIVNSTGVDAIELVGSIAVPGNALGGNTRMRVIKRYNAFGTSCQTGTGFGQAEDYTLSVISVLPCLTGFNYPDTATVPGICDGFTPTEIATDSYAGDYFYVTVTSGETYKFLSDVATDYFTLSTDDGTTAAASGTTPLTWVSDFTGDLRVHLNLDSACGEEEVERTTSVVCGVPCLNGALYPTDAYVVGTCDGVEVNVIATDCWAGEYSNVNVFSSNTYTFSSSIATDYITIASADGTTPLAVGVGTVTYTPLADGVLRFYTHTDSACGTENVSRERQIVCTTAVVVPGCPVNPLPADGSTTVPAFADVILSWDIPTTGDPAVSYDVYGGTTPGNLFFFDNTLTTSYNAGTIGAYDFVGYWQVFALNAAGQSVGCAEWMFTTESQPTDTPDYVNLQYPYTATITEGGSVTVYGQVYEGGLTDVVPNIDGQAPGILAWVGTGETGTDPSTWTDWVVATYNAGHIGDNNDEYQANIGATLTPGTYDYATRFTLNDGPYVYGGINNGIWDGTAHPSGVLTVNAAPAPANDDCAGAIALTPGGVFADNDVDGSNLGATLSTENPAPSCGAFNFATVGKDVWYSVVVPASGSLTIETGTNSLGNGMDTVCSVYSGLCGALVAVNCDDDGATETTFGLTKLALTGQTPGATLLLRVFGYNGSSGSYSISVYDGSLGNSSFDNNNFTFYPNPVKNILNLSYNQEISNVEVFNLLGQKVISNAINANDAQIDMSNLSKGAYMVRVTSNDKVKTIKVMKE